MPIKVTLLGLEMEVDSPEEAIELAKKFNTAIDKALPPVEEKKPHPLLGSRLEPSHPVEKQKVIIQEEIVMRAPLTGKRTIMNEVVASDWRKRPMPDREEAIRISNTRETEGQRLCVEIVYSIRRDIMNNVPCNQILKEYNISKPTYRSIRDITSWKVEGMWPEGYTDFIHNFKKKLETVGVGTPLNLPDKKATKEQVSEFQKSKDVFDLIESGEHPSDVATAMGMSFKEVFQAWSSCYGLLMKNTRDVAKNRLAALQVIHKQMNVWITSLNQSKGKA